MAIHYALLGEMIDDRLFGSAINGTRTSTLHKTQHLELSRLSLSPCCFKTYKTIYTAGTVSMQGYLDA